MQSSGCRATKRSHEVQTAVGRDNVPRGSSGKRGWAGGTRISTRRRDLVWQALILTVFLCAQPAAAEAGPNASTTQTTTPAPPVVTTTAAPTADTPVSGETITIEFYKQQYPQWPYDVLIPHGICERYMGGGNNCKFVKTIEELGVVAQKLSEGLPCTELPSIGLFTGFYDPIESLPEIKILMRPWYSSIRVAVYTKTILEELLGMKAVIKLVTNSSLKTSEAIESGIVDLDMESWQYSTKIQWENHEDLVDLDSLGLQGQGGIMVSDHLFELLEQENTSLLYGKHTWKTIVGWFHWLRHEEGSFTPPGVRDAIWKHLPAVGTVLESLNFTYDSREVPSAVCAECNMTCCTEIFTRNDVYPTGEALPKDQLRDIIKEWNLRLVITTVNSLAFTYLTLQKKMSILLWAWHPFGADFMSANVTRIQITYDGFLAAKGLRSTYDWDSLWLRKVTRKSLATKYPVFAMVVENIRFGADDLDYELQRWISQLALTILQVPTGQYEIISKLGMCWKLNKQQERQDALTSYWLNVVATCWGGLTNTVVNGKCVTSCPEGFFQAGFFTNRNSCEACPVGYYCPDSYTARKCPAGATTMESGSSSSDACLCDKGMQDTQRRGPDRLVQCEECPRGLYKDTIDNAPCRQSCPPNSFMLFTGATSSFFCACARGFYLVTLVGAENQRCAQCPKGAFCKGGFNETFLATNDELRKFLSTPSAAESRLAHTRPEATRNFYGLELIPPVSGEVPYLPKFVPCIDQGTPTNAACLGRNICAEGSTGDRCFVCEKGWLRGRQSHCEKCMSDTGSLVVLFFLFWFTIWLYIHLVRLVRWASTHYDMLSPIVVKIIINYFQGLNAVLKLTGVADQFVESFGLLDNFSTAIMVIANICNCVGYARSFLFCCTHTICKRYLYRSWYERSTDAEWELTVTKAFLWNAALIPIWVPVVASTLLLLFSHMWDLFNPHWRHQVIRNIHACHAMKAQFARDHPSRRGTRQLLDNHIHRLTQRISRFWLWTPLKLLTEAGELLGKEEDEDENSESDDDEVIQKTRSGRLSNQSRQKALIAMSRAAHKPKDKGCFAYFCDYVNNVHIAFENYIRNLISIWAFFWYWIYYSTVGSLLQLSMYCVTLPYMDGYQVRLVMLPQLTCHAGDHWYMWSYGFFLMLFHGIGIPFLIYMIVTWKRTRKIDITYGLNTNGYDHSGSMALYWDVWFMGRSFVINQCMFLRFPGRFEPSWPKTVLIVGLLISLGMQTYVHPFDDRRNGVLNNLEQSALFLLSVSAPMFDLITEHSKKFAYRVIWVMMLLWHVSFILRCAMQFGRDLVNTADALVFRKQYHSHHSTKVALTRQREERFLKDLLSAEGAPESSSSSDEEKHKKDKDKFDISGKTDIEIERYAQDQFFKDLQEVQSTSNAKVSDSGGLQGEHARASMQAPGLKVKEAARPLPGSSSKKRSAGGSTKAAMPSAGRSTEAERRERLKGLVGDGHNQLKDLANKPRGLLSSIKSIRTEAKKGMQNRVRRFSKRDMRELEDNDASSSSSNESASSSSSSSNSSFSGDSEIVILEQMIPPPYSARQARMARRKRRVKMWMESRVEPILKAVIPDMFVSGLNGLRYMLSVEGDSPLMKVLRKLYVCLAYFVKPAGKTAGIQTKGKEFSFAGEAHKKQDVLQQEAGKGARLERFINRLKISKEISQVVDAFEALFSCVVLSHKLHSIPLGLVKHIATNREATLNPQMTLAYGGRKAVGMACQLEKMGDVVDSLIARTGRMKSEGDYMYDLLELDTAMEKVLRQSSARQDLLNTRYLEFMAINWQNCKTSALKRGLDESSWFTGRPPCDDKADAEDVEPATCSRAQLNDPSELQYPRYYKHGQERAATRFTVQAWMENVKKPSFWDSHAAHALGLMHPEGAGAIGAKKSFLHMASATFAFGTGGELSMPVKAQKTMSAQLKNPAPHAHHDHTLKANLNEIERKTSSIDDDVDSDAEEDPRKLPPISYRDIAKLVDDSDFLDSRTRFVTKLLPPDAAFHIINCLAQHLQDAKNNMKEWFAALGASVLRLSHVEPIARGDPKVAQAFAEMKKSMHIMGLRDSDELVHELGERFKRAMLQHGWEKSNKEWLLASMALKLEHLNVRYTGAGIPIIGPIEKEYLELYTMAATFGDGFETFYEEWSNYEPPLSDMKAWMTWQVLRRHMKMIKYAKGVKTNESQLIDSRKQKEKDTSHGNPREVAIFGDAMRSVEELEALVEEARPPEGDLVGSHPRECFKDFDEASKAEANRLLRLHLEEWRKRCLDWTFCIAERILQAPGYSVTKRRNAYIHDLETFELEAEKPWESRLSPSILQDDNLMHSQKIFIKSEYLSSFYLISTVVDVPEAEAMLASQEKLLTPKGHMGMWLVQKVHDTGSLRIMSGDEVYLKNLYGSGSFLDARQQDIDGGEIFCVSADHISKGRPTDTFRITNRMGEGEIRFDEEVMIANVDEKTPAFIVSQPPLRHPLRHGVNLNDSLSPIPISTTPMWKDGKNVSKDPDFKGTWLLSPAETRLYEFKCYRRFFNGQTVPEAIQFVACNKGTHDLIEVDPTHTGMRLKHKAGTHLEATWRCGICLQVHDIPKGDEDYSLYFRHHYCNACDTHICHKCIVVLNKWDTMLEMVDRLGRVAVVECKNPECKQVAEYDLLPGDTCTRCGGPLKLKHYGHGHHNFAILETCSKHNRAIVIDLLRRMDGNTDTVLMTDVGTFTSRDVLIWFSIQIKKSNQGMFEERHCMQGFHKLEAIPMTNTTQREEFVCQACGRKTPKRHLRKKKNDEKSKYTYEFPWRKRETHSDCMSCQSCNQSFCPTCCRVIAAVTDMWEVIERCCKMRVLNLEVADMLKHVVGHRPDAVLELLLELEIKSDWERELRMRQTAFGASSKSHVLNHTETVSHWALAKLRTYCGDSSLQDMYDASHMEWHEALDKKGTDREKAANRAMSPTNVKQAISFVSGTDLVEERSSSKHTNPRFSKRDSTHSKSSKTREMSATLTLRTGKTMAMESTNRSAVSMSSTINSISSLLTEEGNQFFEDPDDSIRRSSFKEHKSCGTDPEDVFILQEVYEGKRSPRSLSLQPEIRNRGVTRPGDWGDFRIQKIQESSSKQSSAMCDMAVQVQFDREGLANMQQREMQKDKEDGIEIVPTLDATDQGKSDRFVFSKEVSACAMQKYKSAEGRLSTLTTIVEKTKELLAKAVSAKHIERRNPELGRVEIERVFTTLQEIHEGRERKIASEGDTASARQVSSSTV